MILQKEIAAIAYEKGILKTAIDKDWALDHFLDERVEMQTHIESLKDLKYKDVLLGLC